MKKQSVILIFLLYFLHCSAQKVQTIVPTQVVAGNAFQIQYIVAEPPNLVNLSTPQFENLRLVSGPNYYKGNSVVNGRMEPIQNITYTVIALKPGPVKIDGVTAKFRNNISEKTDDVIINVVPQPKASFNVLSNYTDIEVYAPSSKADFERLVEENLFIKTDVSKKMCFLGEPIVATFKLYSRLQSTSEVINAPSLYGFSVMDILNINEAHQTVETINGKVFNTSVLRKLQLYPAQTGQFVIDEMQLQNEIEFVDSMTRKKLKVEKFLSSKPIKISVRPLPSKQPSDYTGAVGKFEITARFQNSKMMTGQQGKLIVAITGKGNFIQFGPPVIDWPKEFDVLDPAVSDDISRNTVPASGKREFSFSFICDHPGKFLIPAINFSFFDPSANSYKRIKTDSLDLEINASQEIRPDRDEIKKSGSSIPVWKFLIPILLLLMITVFFLIKKEKKPAQPSPVIKPTYAQKFQAIRSSQLTHKQTIIEIQKLLSEITVACDLTSDQKKELQLIQNYCQLLIYSDITEESEKAELEKRTKNLITEIGC